MPIPLLAIAGVGLAAFIVRQSLRDQSLELYERQMLVAVSSGRSIIKTRRITDGRQFALKFVDVTYASPSAGSNKERAETEARVERRIRSKVPSHLQHLFLLFEDTIRVDQYIIFVTPWIDRTLESWLVAVEEAKEFREPDADIPPEQFYQTYAWTLRDYYEDILCLFIETCTAIQALHSVNIIHQDIKPQNLFVRVTADSKPHIVVGDFDFSCIFENGWHSCGHRQGTTGYDDVIIYTQKLGNYISVKSDIYSLGATFIRAFFRFRYRTDIPKEDLWMVREKETVALMNQRSRTTFPPRLMERFKSPAFKVSQAIVRIVDIVLVGILRGMVQRESARRPDLSRVLARLDCIRSVLVEQH